MIERQGKLFVITVLLMAIANRLLPEVSLSVLLVMIVMLGVPHGALDTIYAQRQFGLKGLRSWALFGFVYLLPVLLMIGLWRVAATWFFIGFLVISAIHFSGDPEPRVPPIVRFLYGGAVIVLPAWRHSSEVALLFSSLVPAEEAQWLTTGLAVAAIPWAVALGLSALWVARSQCWVAAEIGAVAFLCAWASPLVSFTVFFCGMHSPRHILRSFQYAGFQKASSLLAAACAPLVATLILLGFCFAVLPDAPVDTKLTQLIFVALAALTVPHMALVERDRFAGWPRAAGAYLRSGRGAKA